jgi:hypothetical protein
MTKKHKGEVKVSVKGNPFTQNTENAWNFGVYKTDHMSVDLGIKEILELLKRLRKG